VFHFVTIDCPGSVHDLLSFTLSTLGKHIDVTIEKMQGTTYLQMQLTRPFLAESHCMRVGGNNRGREKILLLPVKPPHQH
jgi:hypothetical protein